MYNPNQKQNAGLSTGVFNRGMEEVHKRNSAINSYDRNPKMDKLNVRKPNHTLHMLIAKHHLV